MNDGNVEQVPPKRSSEWSKRTTFMATLEAKGQRRREEEPNGDPFEGVFENDTKKSGREVCEKKGEVYEGDFDKFGERHGQGPLEKQG